MRNNAVAFGIVLCLTCGLAGSCKEAPRPGESQATHASNGRVVVPVQWRRVWMTGGAENDTTLLLPWRLALGTHLVIVADKGGARIAAFRKEDGALAWIRGRKGSGPGEYQEPTAVAVDGRDRIWVADATNRRIDVWTPDGELYESFTPPDLSYPEAMCPLPSGDMLVATSAQTNPLLRISESGRVVSRTNLPWPDLVGAPPLAVTKLLAPIPHGCVLALVFGHGFAVLSDGGVRTFPYVESFPLPQIESNVEPDGTTSNRIVNARISATGVATADGQIAVSPERAGELTRRIVDVYDQRSGAYVRSYATPVSFEEMVRSGDTYYFLTHRAGYPALVAVRPEAVTEAQADSAIQP